MKRLAVIGQPVSHSRSPAMQQAALAELGLGEEWSYEALELSAEEFADRVPGLAGEGFVGVNVTIPHKERALALAGEATERARQIGAANTLTFDAGAIRADNTDAGGLIAAVGPVSRGAPALVLGAGGAGRAAAWALRQAGADVTVWNRTAPRAAALATAFRISAVPEGGSPDAAKAAVIVNATAVGLGAEAGSLASLPLDASDLRPGQMVVDLPYGGGEETELAAAAREAGADVIDGIELLVRQGAESLRIWTGLNPPLGPMRAAARA